MIRVFHYMSNLFICIIFYIFVWVKNNDRIRTELIKMIKDHGTQVAINSVGGYDNFKIIMGIESIMDFLNLFNGMDVINNSDTRKSWILYQFNPNRSVMICDTEKNWMYVNNNDIWQFLMNCFDVDKWDIREIFKSWLTNEYNISDVIIPVGVEFNL